jgi:hypothetical protein
MYVPLFDLLFSGCPALALRFSDSPPGFGAERAFFPAGISLHFEITGSAICVRWKAIS